MLPLFSIASDSDTTIQSIFTAYSNAFQNNGNYPKIYTCDSLSYSPPVSWKNIPAGTTSFAITMHHIPKDGGKHVYMLLYNIPMTINSISENERKIGIWGKNTHNNILGYAPPCSKGPGAKPYIITVYALSKSNILSGKRGVTYDELQNEIKDNILAQSSITIYYSR